MEENWLLIIWSLCWLANMDLLDLNVNLTIPILPVICGVGSLYEVNTLNHFHNSYSHYVKGYKSNVIIWCLNADTVNHFCKPFGKKWNFEWSSILSGYIFVSLGSKFTANVVFCYTEQRGAVSQLCFRPNTIPQTAIYLGYKWQCIDN